MKSLKRIGRDKSGFTTMELVVVIGIIGILAAVAIPGISAWVPDYKLKSAVQDLYSNMQRAKMEAIKQNTNRSIVFNPTGGTYTKPDGSTVSFSDYGSDIEYGRPDSGSNVTYTDGTSVTFQPRGFAEDGEVYVTNDKGTSYYVGTTVSGVVRLRKWNGSSWE